MKWLTLIMTLIIFPLVAYTSVLTPNKTIHCPRYTQLHVVPHGFNQDYHFSAKNAEGKQFNSNFQVYMGSRAHIPYSLSLYYSYYIPGTDTLVCHYNMLDAHGYIIQVPLYNRGDY